MQTNFKPELLADPDFKESERVVRTCVHCGFCTATCPTYVLLGVSHLLAAVADLGLRRQVEAL